MAIIFQFSIKFYDLGCVNIPLHEIPSTGLEGWFKLEARSQRSSVQGRIRLKLWLSTREDRGTSEEDNWTEVRNQCIVYINLICVNYRCSNTTGPSARTFVHCITRLRKPSAGAERRVKHLRMWIIRSCSYFTTSTRRSRRFILFTISYSSLGWCSETKLRHYSRCKVSQIS